jgi:hypothetical protein
MGLINPYLSGYLAYFTYGSYKSVKLPDVVDIPLLHFHVHPFCIDHLLDHCHHGSIASSGSLTPYQTLSEV